VLNYIVVQQSMILFHGSIPKQSFYTDSAMLGDASSGGEDEEIK
jgi:hypothetical protein